MGQLKAKIAAAGGGAALKRIQGTVFTRERLVTDGGISVHVTA